MREKVLDFIVIVAGLVGIVLLVFILLPYVRKPQLSKNTKQQSKKVVTLTGLEIAKRIATYLDNAMLPNGDFIPSYLCEKERQKCTPRALAKNTVPQNEQMIIAYFELYKKTGDKKYKEKADKTMAFILSECKKTVQACFINLEALSTYYTDTKDPRYLSAIEKVSSFALEEPSPEQYIKLKTGYQLPILYETTRDVKYKIAYEKVTKSLLESPLNPTTFAQSPLFLLNLAYGQLIAYQVFDNPSYLARTQQIIDKTDIQNNSRRLDDPQFNNKYSLLLRLLLELGEDAKLPNNKYANQADFLAQEILNRYTDQPENIRFEGDGSFITIYLDHDKKSLTIKSTINNGLLTQLFIYMSNEKFNIESKM